MGLDSPGTSERGAKSAQNGRGPGAGVFSTRPEDKPQRGDIGGTAERYPRGTQEAPERHPRGTREAPERHPRGTREAPERYPRGTRDVPERYPRGTREVPERHPRDTREVPERQPRGTREVPETQSRDTREVPPDPVNGPARGQRQTATQAERDHFNEGNKQLGGVEQNLLSRAASPAVLS